MAGKRYCYACGTRLPACPVCSSPLEPHYAYCPDCGTALVSVPAAPTLSTDTGSETAIALPEEEQRMDRRMVSVLFCDLVGFTPLSEKLDPEELREVQDRYFGLMSGAIERYGGTVEKYAGDAVLAIFGAPIVHEDDAERAIHCALAMHHALIPLAEETLAIRGVNLMLRIGINTGEVVSGLREGGGRVDYAVTGDVVNTANRYETAAEPGGVMVAETTMMLSRRRFLFGERQMLTLKGKSQQVPGYPVIGVRERLAERWELSGHEAELVGREQEMGLLLAAWAAAAGAAGRAIEIVAEPGTGKSRLLAEAQARMSDVRRILHGRSVSYSTQISLHLVAGVLRSAFEIPEHQPASTLGPQIAAGVAGRLAELPDEERSIAEDVFGEALGLPAGGSVLAGASAQVRRHGLVESLRRLLRGITAEGPVLLILEDTHWIDTASREVLTEALADLSSLALLVVATRRPEGDDLFSQQWSQRLDLQPLGAADSLVLASTILGDVPLSDALRAEIVERSGGNPFFVEELLRALHDADAVEEIAGVMHLRSGASERLPSSLQELLQARLDGLERVPRTVAQVGSVIGRTFAVRLVAGTLEVEEAGLDGPLSALERAEIALPDTDGERAYSFKHATVQETAYKTLLKRRRQALHAATARALIVLYPADEHVETIAYHYRMTEEHREAAAWLERAADRAAAVFANETAIDQYTETRRRQDLIDAPLADRARVDEKLGRILRIAARYDDALATMERSARAYLGADDAEGERRAVAEIGRVHRAAGSTDEGAERVRGFLTRQAGAAHSSGLAALHVALARLYFTLGRYQEQVEVASAGAELAAAAGDRRVLVEAEMSRSIGQHALGHTEEALAVMEAAIPVAEEIGDFEVLGILLNNVALVYREAGDFERSREYRLRSAKVKERMGDVAARCFAEAAVGELAFLQGDWGEARVFLDRAVAMARSLGNSWWYFLPLVLLGQLHSCEGDFAAARACLGEALDVARQNDQQQGIAGAIDRLAEADLVSGEGNPLARYEGVLDLDNLGEGGAALTSSLPIIAWAYLENGDVETAARLADDGMDRAVRERAVVDLIAAQRVAGMAGARRGQWEYAASHFRKVLSLARQVRYPYAEALINYEWGRMLLDEGKIDEARDRLRQARDTFERLGAIPYLRRAEAALATIDHFPRRVLA